MYSLLISIAALVLGYVFYGAFVEKLFGPDPSAKTPAFTKRNGVDYEPLPTWKVVMIQFLNIAGTGPIFGAVLGALFGPACFIWIVLGCIFGGAVHDYFSGMLSVRNGGKALPDFVGLYLGNGVKKVLLVFSCVMLFLVGAVFVYSPALIIGNVTSGFLGGAKSATLIWVAIILFYYIVATVLPIDKIIGKIYPVFAVSMIFMAVAFFVCLVVKWPSIPEVWNGLENRNAAAGPIFPCMFITIACGAVSGFHSTQSPLMARCIKNENLGRKVFYGSMIMEGMVALIWASISSYFFYAGGNAELGALDIKDAPSVITVISKGWLGLFGSILAILGVVAAPITSGDTALRSIRIIIADAFHLNQNKARDRVSVSLPIFIVTGLLLTYNILDSNGFDVIWRYFGWANQTISIFTFWALTVFLVRKFPGKMHYLVGMIPACFMTAVSLTFISISKIGFNLPNSIAPYLGASVFIISAIIFNILKKKAGLK